MFLFITIWLPDRILHFLLPADSAVYEVLVISVVLAQDHVPIQAPGPEIKQFPC